MQTFDEWLSSEHMKTFIALRLSVIDEKEPNYTDGVGLVATAAIRRELRTLATWRPEMPEEKIEQQRQTNYKAGEYLRNLRK